MSNVSVHKLIGHLKFTRFYFIWRARCKGISLSLNTLSLQNGEQINQNRQILAKERKISNVQKFSVLYRRTQQP